MQSSSSQQQQQQSPPEGNDNDDGGHLVPSFQDAFNKAFETASESVVAAHRGIGGMSCCFTEFYCTIFFVIVQPLEESQVARQPRKGARNLFSFPLGAVGGPTDDYY